MVIHKLIVCSNTNSKGPRVMRAGEVRAIHNNGRPSHGRYITNRCGRFTSSISSLFSTAVVTNSLDGGVFGWSMFRGARTLHSYRGQVVGYVCPRCISSTPLEENVLLSWERARSDIYTVRREPNVYVRVVLVWRIRCYELDGCWILRFFFSTGRILLII